VRRVEEDASWQQPQTKRQRSVAISISEFGDENIVTHVQGRFHRRRGNVKGLIEKGPKQQRDRTGDDQRFYGVDRLAEPAVSLDSGE
jgi:hypothetical protein